MKIKGKGAQFGLVIVVALALIFFFVIGFFAFDYSKTVKESLRFQKCKESVRINSLARSGAHVFSSNVECPIKNVVIDDEEDEKIDKRIAEEIIECKEIFMGDNGMELFSGEDVFCSVCSLIDIEKEGQVKGFFDYISENEAEGKGVKIIEYIGPKKSKSYQGEEGLEQIKDANIDASKTYAVIFAHARGKDLVEDLLIRSETMSGKFALGSFLSSAGSAGLMVAFGSNPVGWVVAGSGLLVGSVSAVYNYFFEPGQPTQWLSVVYLREYDEAAFDEIGCTVLPVSQGNI